MKLFGRVIAGLAILLVAAAVIGWFALRRADIPYATLEARYANAASRYVDLPGDLHVHYRDQGKADGPVLVMIHGYSASLHTWEPWVQRLGDRYRIVSIDLPGHGLTRAPKDYPAGFDAYADYVDAVTRKLGLTRFVYIGNSMGGGVGWDFALRHPERLDGLVLVDAAGWQRPNQSTPLVFKILANPIGRALLKDLGNRPLIKAGLEDAYLDKSLVTPAVVNRYVELSRAPGHRDILMALQARRPPMAPDDFARRLAGIAVPTLVMHGEQDKLVPFADGQAFAKAIPGAVLVAYPNVGHVPMEQIPDRSAADLAAWLQAKVYPNNAPAPAA